MAETPPSPSSIRLQKSEHAGKEKHMPEIMHLIRVGVARERVYEALTTSEGIRGWWTRDAGLGAEPGGFGEFRFGDGQRVTRVRIDELSPPYRVAWKTVSSFRPEWVGTTITFDLRGEGSGTVLVFAQRGFTQADEGYAITTTGWGYYLVSLQQYLETGEGAPSPDVRFARVLR
jgi:uncharacterized protein YndB with AHSA1/START domain